ncbi:hypothetical protein BJ165DRAFT_1598685 [Panaeolus papilionaceus]|nr:hypothetical protein BJ165DRAFT_1598685 [Panaeolus papilionaceus]
MSLPEYIHLKIIGDISVKPMNEKLPEDALVYHLWGPTGAGKSGFIQAIAGDSQDLGISKDQLAGFTQKASAYQVVNVLFQEEERDRPVYLIDTPGFCDPKISSVGVLGSGADVGRDISYDKILFLTPITDTRMPGTKRRTIDLITTMLQPSSCRTAFVIVTTMWDKLHTEHVLQRAESNYGQLRDDVFKACGIICDNTLPA